MGEGSFFIRDNELYSVAQYIFCDTKIKDLATYRRSGLPHRKEQIQMSEQSPFGSIFRISF